MHTLGIFSNSFMKMLHPGVFVWLMLLSTYNLGMNDLAQGPNSSLVMQIFELTTPQSEAQFCKHWATNTWLIIDWLIDSVGMASWIWTYYLKCYLTIWLFDCCALFEQDFTQVYLVPEHLKAKLNDFFCLFVSSELSHMIWTFL